MTQTSWSRLLTAISLPEGAPLPVAGFAVGAMTVASRAAGKPAQVCEQFPRSVLPHVGNGISVGAVLGGVDVRAAGHNEVPAQELEEKFLAGLLGCSTQGTHQLIHVAHSRHRL